MIWSTFTHSVTLQLTALLCFWQHRFYVQTVFNLSPSQLNVRYVHKAYSRGATEFPVLCMEGMAWQCILARFAFAKWNDNAKCALGCGAAREGAQSEARELLKLTRFRKAVYNSIAAPTTTQTEKVKINPPHHSRIQERIYDACNFEVQ